jgi:hypothetical protein
LRKCLHFYFYFLDPEFGFMHVRVQSWLPFTIQIYVNGHEWLCRQLDRRGIGYQRYDNALLSIDDPATAAHLCRRFARLRWPPTLAEGLEKAGVGTLVELVEAPEVGALGHAHPSQ